MKKYWWLFALCAVVVAGAGGVFGMKAWQAHVRKSADDRGFARAQKALSERRPKEALALFQAVDRSKSPHPWPKVEIAALSGMGHFSRLVAIFEKSPDRIYENEDACLLVSRVYLHSRQREKLALVMAGHKSTTPAWGMLEVDALMLDGKAKEAKKLLESRRYESTNDVQRLIRLAILSDLRHPTNAWNLLAEAAALDPKNPDVRSFRGQLLEALGKTALARVEYVSALVASPDPLRRDQLAEFYRRQGSLDLALSTWRDGLKTNSIDFLWLKASFWERMLSKEKEVGTKGTIPNGVLSGLAKELIALPANEFWSPGLAGEYAARQQFATARQEMFWLQLADELKNGKEREARERLKFVRASSVSWSPELARALGQILAWRVKTNQTLNPSSLAFAQLTTNSHSFFVKLEQQSLSERNGKSIKRLPEELHGVISGEHAFAAAFLAAGWREAGLTLADPERLPVSAPEWVVYAYGQAMRYNRGPEVALRFLTTRASTPVLELLVAEIQLGTGKNVEAFAALDKLSKLSGDVGFRAAWLLATADLERGDFAATQRHIAVQPQLARSELGKELLARVALAQNKPEEAERIYRGIEKTSVEARAFLARRAFREKDWKVARKYTQELLAIMPDQLELRANLNAIAAAETGQ